MRSRIHAYVDGVAHSPNHTVVRPLINWLIDSLVHSWVDSSMAIARWLIDALARSFVGRFVYSLIDTLMESMAGSVTDSPLGSLIDSWDLWSFLDELVLGLIDSLIV